MSDSPPNPTPTPSPLPTVINPIQFHYSINPKLDESNFLLWKSQVLPVIRGHGLLSFLDSPTVSSTLTVSSDGRPSTLQLDMWHRQDQLILAWLLSSIGPAILPQVICCATSADLWHLLHSTFSVQSTSRVLDLKFQLHTLKNGNLTYTEYLNRLKSVALQLRSIGCEVSDQDLSLCLYAGLLPEYNSLVTSLTPQHTAFSIADLHGHLLSFESRLASQALCDHTAHLTLGDSSKLIPSSSFIPNGAGFGSLPIGPVKPSTVHSDPLLPTPLPAGSNSASSPNLSSILAPALLSTLSWQTQQQLATAYISQHLSRTSYRGGRGRGSGRGRGRSNYLYKASLNGFQGHGNGGTGGNSGYSSQGNTAPLHCQICMKIGHAAKECWYRYDDDLSPPPQVNLAQPSSSPTSDWFLDSGASSHIVPDLNCLTNYTPYQGNDVVRVSNGHGLSTSHTGSSFLSSGQHKLTLKNVLHVPHITKRLISISRLTQDNNVIIEFHNSGCVIKDPKTHTVLLEGGISEGLYFLPSAATILCDVSSSNIWHHWLGHTSTPVL